MTAVRDTQDTLIGFAKVVRDKSSQKDASDKLAELNRTLEERVKQRTRELVRNQERLRAMASDLILTEQRERRRLASDLHDYLAQLLVVCRLKLSQGPSLTDMESLRKIIQEADTVLDQSLVYTRTLVSQLSPSCLYEFGLPAALVWLGSDMGKQGFSVKVTGGHLTLDLQEDQAVLMYQCVRELLFNVLKHSGVKEATVTLAIQPDHRLNIEVEDLGCGFSDDLKKEMKVRQPNSDFLVFGNGWKPSAGRSHSLRFPRKEHMPSYLSRWLKLFRRSHSTWCPSRIDLLPGKSKTAARDRRKFVYF